MNTTRQILYDYITIMVSGSWPTYCFISINGDNYVELKLAEAKGSKNYNEVIKIIKKYEKEGYQVFANNLTRGDSSSEICFLLRRESKE